MIDLAILDSFKVSLNSHLVELFREQTTDEKQNNLFCNVL